MAKARSPERDKVRRAWLESGGTMTAKQLAEQFGVRAEQAENGKALIIGKQTLTHRNRSGNAADSRAIKMPWARARP